MANQRKLLLLERLLTVQRVKRIGAEVTLAEAQQREREVQCAEDAARADSTAARDEWLDHVAQPSFSLDLLRNLSWHVLQRDEILQEAERVTTRHGEITAARRNLWQIAEAQVRHSEVSARTLHRALDRKREEKRLAEMSDRMTFGALHK